MSKEKVLEYCKRFTMPDLSHIENAIDNARMIEKGEYKYLNGCPSAYGLDDYVGICEEMKDGEYEALGMAEQENVCEACWKRALGVEEDV